MSCMTWLHVTSLPRNLPRTTGILRPAWKCSRSSSVSGMHRLVLYSCIEHTCISQPCSRTTMWLCGTVCRLLCATLASLAEHVWTPAKTSLWTATRRCGVSVILTLSTGVLIYLLNRQYFSIAELLKYCYLQMLLQVSSEYENLYSPRNW